jgi:hypothetical protein
MGLATMGCGRSTHRTLEVEDFLIEPRRPIEGLPRARSFSCAEEEQLAVRLGGRARFEWVGQLDGSTALEVTLCGTSERLRVQARLPDGGSPAWNLDVGPGWTSSRLQLPGQGQVHLSIAVEGAPGQAVFLRDLALRRERAAPAPARVPRAILISLDTVREDALGALSGGGGGRETPHLDRLAAEAERFSPHWAADISTKPSHASMLTGLPARVHGADRASAPLSSEVPTLAERLRDLGVATAGLASSSFFKPRFGLDRGFASYRVLGWSPTQELRSAVGWIAAHRDQASFLFVHLYAAHSDRVRLPYEGPGNSAAAIETRFGLADYGCRGVPSPPLHAAVELCASRLLAHMNFDRSLRPRPHEAEALRYLYDRGVSGLDQDLERFFTDLRAMSLWDDTLVMVTADHGEQFGEHGRFLHATAHEETLRVPLLVKWPGGRRGGTASAQPSTSLDLAPTLLAHFGATADDLVGRDLAQRPQGSPVLVSFDAIRVGELKLVLASPQHPEALYDLAADPVEQHDLLPGEAASAERLRRAWTRYTERARDLAGRPAASARLPFDAEEIERLRSLGYLN